MTEFKFQLGGVVAAWKRGPTSNVFHLYSCACNALYKVAFSVRMCTYMYCTYGVYCC